MAVTSETHKESGFFGPMSEDCKIYSTTITDTETGQEWVGGGSTPEKSQEKASERYQDSLRNR